MLALLTSVEAAGDEATGLAALTALARRPGAVIRLDVAARRTHRPEGSGRWTAPSSPLGLALACTHRDGRIRERAVREVVARPLPELVPFLVVRTGDWVREVRDRARAGLAVLLHDDPARFLPAAAGVGLRIERWLRGTFVRNQLLATATDPRAPLESLLASPDREVRLFAFTAGTWRLDRKVSVALTAPDVRLRSAAAEAVARDCAWTGRVEVLRRLAASPHAEVRVQALTGLVRLGRDAEVLPYLDDTSSLVRALARAAASRQGVDVPAYYRSRVSPGAIDGFAEVRGDGRHLVELLSHPSATIRARAVRALRLLEQAPADRVLSMLRDPSSPVVREATAAVRSVPPTLPWELLADERPAVRLAGYRLARQLGPVAELRAALTAVGDGHVRLARRGRADAARMARSLVSVPWRRRTVVPLEPGAQDGPELRALLERAAAGLDEQTSHLLREHLARPDRPVP
ncbi:hypothetical protein FHX81_3168 [Saccharothrix saharensis]|uniref:HEAT repeat protein n=1 Tax=Saccharothrix saharensis TaxID=571190 RepID=A0A543JDD0_9PSEU|nr:hypothetical protein FHX81_3168 [Saccharothrix saharensis]